MSRLTEYQNAIPSKCKAADKEDHTISDKPRRFVESCEVRYLHRTDLAAIYPPTLTASLIEV